MVVVCATAMPILAISKIRKTPEFCCVAASTTLVAPSARNVALVSSKKLGDSLNLTSHLYANVSVRERYRNIELESIFFLACNCFEHSNECIYDPEVDRQRLSLDIHGKFEGGGVCQNCQHNTEGVNCNRCKPGFYRPYHKAWNETDVCQRTS